MNYNHVDTAGTNYYFGTNDNNLYMVLQDAISREKRLDYCNFLAMNVRDDGTTKVAYVGRFNSGDTVYAIKDAASIAYLLELWQNGSDIPYPLVGDPEPNPESDTGLANPYAISYPPSVYTSTGTTNFIMNTYLALKASALISNGYTISNCLVCTGTDSFVYVDSSKITTSATQYVINLEGITYYTEAGHCSYTIVLANDSDTKYIVGQLSDSTTSYILTEEQYYTVSGQVSTVSNGTATISLDNDLYGSKGSIRLTQKPEGVEAVISCVAPSELVVDKYLPITFPATSSIATYLNGGSESGAKAEEGSTAARINLCTTHSLRVALAKDDTGYLLRIGVIDKNSQYENENPPPNIGYGVCFMPEGRLDSSVQLPSEKYTTLTVSVEEGYLVIPSRGWGANYTPVVAQGSWGDETETFQIETTENGYGINFNREIGEDFTNHYHFLAIFAKNQSSSSSSSDDLGKSAEATKSKVNEILVKEFGSTLVNVATAELIFIVGQFIGGSTAVVLTQAQMTALGETNPWNMPYPLVEGHSHSSGNIIETQPQFPTIDY